jgi:hypothetical protein
MKHPFIEVGRGPEAPGRVIEAMFETAVALAIAVAIGAGVISLSVHLNEAQNARAPAVEASAVVPSSSAGAASGTHMSTDLE